MKKRDWLFGRGCLLLTTLIWGTSFVVLKDALDTLPVLLILAVRFTGAAALLALAGLRQLRALDRPGLAGGAVMGVMLFLAYVLQTWGLAYTEPGVNAFLSAAYCVLVPFLSWLLLHRRPDRWNAAAAVLCVAGMALVCLKADLSIGLGEGLSAASGLFFALHILITDRTVQGRSPLALTTVQFAVCAVLGWVCVLCTGALPRQAVPSDVWLRVAYLCVACTTLTYLLQVTGQKHTPPGAAAVLLTLEAVFGTAFSILVYGERPSVRMCVGFALIFVSVLVSETKLRFLRRRRDEPETE
ncbi:MAG: DMT family transporter [Clostridiales bacterium]|nr:DMT family transporter [Clostridiales bacterium]